MYLLPTAQIPRGTGNSMRDRKQREYIQILKFTKLFIFI